MALNLARFNGNLNPDKPDDQTVLDFLQRSRIAKQAQDNQNALNLREQTQFNEEDPVRAAINLKTLGYIKGQPSDQQQSMPSPTVPQQQPQQPPIDTSVNLRAPMGQPENPLGTFLGLKSGMNPPASQQPAQPQQIDPLQAYQDAVSKKNALLKSGLDVTNQRLQKESDPGWQAAMQNPMFKGLDLQGTKNEEERQANLEAQANLPVQQALIPIRSAALKDIANVTAQNEGRGQGPALTAAYKDIRAKYPMLNGDEAFEKAMVEKTPPNEFNMNGIETMANVRKGNNIMNRFNAENDKYDKAINSLENIRSVRFNDDGSQNPAWGKGAGDISLINQLSTGEYAGYKPTTTEYMEFGKNLSVPDMFQKWKEKVSSGAVLPNDVRENMYNEILRVAKRNHDNFGKTVKKFQTQAEKQGIDPEAYVMPSGTYQDVDEFLKKNPIAGSGTGGGAAHPQDSQAVEWAKANPTDPRAGKILQLNGAK